MSNFGAGAQARLKEDSLPTGTGGSQVTEASPKEQNSGGGRGLESHRLGGGKHPIQYR